MIKCITVDNEKLAKEKLTSDLGKIHGVKIMGVYSNAFDALRTINSEEIHLVFCDIQIPEIDGISFFKSLQNPPLFVFVTADAKYAVEGYELNIFDYILKPVDIDRLIKTINKAHFFLDSLKASAMSRNYMIIKEKNSRYITAYDEIHYIKGDKDYAYIFTKEKVYYVWQKLMNLEESLLDVPQFIRVHKSFIVNLDFADQVKGNTIKMKGTVVAIPIGARYKVDLFKKLGIIVQ
ncbi:LytR/AlgR family response regulator transcription factor [Sphingobacterium psychroaquaticum]|uniref:Two component transcriptional regulator, LytTR family n=1 Tax=Sphingobacterium psychroaquaticum TaxID=561061 RepID=A0A1X7HV92_9SPHI|nr:LytTR family DNA-binding domain-containing protein [Sphingobacterium psychroaquaticum]SMG05916.1 two component transcriptional regulator, LytTR family [Sphingobacterium psychroaquaticum]